MIDHTQKKGKRIMEALSWFRGLNPRLQERIRKYIVEELMIINPDFMRSPKDEHPKVTSFQLVFESLKRSDEFKTTQEIYSSLKNELISKGKTERDVAAILRFLTHQKIAEHSEHGYRYRRRHSA